MGVVVGAQLVPGELVRVEFLLPHVTSPVRATAVVRYQREWCFGLQFHRLPVEQQSVIRYWTRSEGELLLAAGKSEAAPEAAIPEGAAVPATWLPEVEDPEESTRRFQARHVVALAVAVVAVAAALGWWRWRQEWTVLDARIPAAEVVAETPPFKVPADVMQQRLLHLVRPEYPEAARRAGVQGAVVLDAVVNAEGTVTQMKLVSGPQGLSVAAMDAVRRWRYEPYLVNSRPAAVETTVVVNFQLVN
jgi:TonB family protein